MVNANPVIGSLLCRVRGFVNVSAGDLPGKDCRWKDSSSWQNSERAEAVLLPKIQTYTAREYEGEIIRKRVKEETELGFFSY